MPIEAVIFDVGGVLEINPRTGWQERWAAMLGLDSRELDRRLESTFAAGSVGTIALTDVEREIAVALSLDNTTLDSFMNDLWAEYLGALNEDLAAYFSELRPRYRTGILSNSFVGAREREQALYGFEQMCDVVVYSHEEGLMKPDPLFYRLVCDRLGVRLEESVLLDDVQLCVDGARRVGMKAIRFIDNEQAVRELERLLDRRTGVASRNSA
jgi:epoxide hydrolase-like predicted phosphatase